MGIFNKIKKPSDKKTVINDKDRGGDKQDLTLAQLKDQNSKKSTTVKKEENIKKEDTKNAYKVLLHPLATEKGTYLSSQNKYVFEVAKKANKTDIKRAIYAVYGINPISVRTISLLGKKVRYGKTRGKTSDRKKAIITLKKNESIQIYEGV